MLLYEAEMPHEEFQLEHGKSHLHAGEDFLLEEVVRLRGFVGYDFVVLRIDGLWDHVGVVVVVEDAAPYHVGGGVNVLDDEGASAAGSGYDLGLRNERIVML